MTHSTKNTTSRGNSGAPRRSRKLLALIGAALMAGAPVAGAYAQDAGNAPKPPVAAAPDANGAAKDATRMADRDGGRGMRERHGRHGRQMGGRGGHRRMTMMMRMATPAKIAGALATLETGMGITPEQLAVWRRFSGALVAFADASRPPRMGPGTGAGLAARTDSGNDQSADAADQMDPSDETADTTAQADDQADADTLDADASDDGASDADIGDQADAAAESDTGDTQPGARAFRLMDRFADRAIARGEAAKTLKTAVAELQTTLTPEQIATGRGIMRSMMREARQEFRKDRRDKRGDRMERGEMRHGWHHGRHGHHGDFADRGGRGGHDGFGPGGRHGGDHRGGWHRGGRDGGPDGKPGMDDRQGANPQDDAGDADNG